MISDPANTNMWKSLRFFPVNSLVVERAVKAHFIALYPLKAMDMHFFTFKFKLYGIKDNQKIVTTHCVVL